MTDSDLAFITALARKRATLLDRLKTALLGGDWKGLIEIACALCGLGRPQAVTRTDDGFEIVWPDRHPHRKNNDTDHDQTITTIDKKRTTAARNRGLARLQ